MQFLRDMVSSFLLGPILCLFPGRWRSRFNFTYSTWKIAGLISGGVEAIGAIVALVAWYSYSVSNWAQYSIVATSEAHPEATVPEGTEGFAALILLLLHPLTWLIFYCAIEGVIRLLAAGITGSVVGILPIYLIDRLCFRQRNSDKALIINFAFFLIRLPRLKWILRKPPLPDELTMRSDLDGEVLEIRSYRPKEGWDPPRIVHFAGVYYSLFQIHEERSETRPFVFLLRRLSTGVQSRSVIEYSR